MPGFDTQSVSVEDVAKVGESRGPGRSLPVPISAPFDTGNQ